MQNLKDLALFSTYELGELVLPNRIVMASLTRARATNPGLVPTDLHARYYAQRASAGLIITESSWVSKRAVGFLNIPGMYTPQQVEGWQGVTRAVHGKGGTIFAQLVHSGAVSHPCYLDGERPFGPSAINPGEQVYTPDGFAPTPLPQAYSVAAIKTTLAEFRQAAANAKMSGFDGVELHAQLFTLIPQFLSAATNQRHDAYGGSIENRCRIFFEILDELISVFPGKKVGVKFTPAAFNNGIIQPDEETADTFAYMLHKLNTYDIAFVELVGPRKSLKGTPIAIWENDFFGWFRSHFQGTIMANLGFMAGSANDIILQKKADLVSFGQPFIANPDLAERFKNQWPLADADTSTFYAGEEKGYTDYPNYSHSGHD